MNPLENLWPKNTISLKDDQVQAVHRPAQRTGWFLRGILECMHLMAWQVKQIVGGTLNDATQATVTNFVSPHSSAHFARMYRDVRACMTSSSAEHLIRMVWRAGTSLCLGPTTTKQRARRWRCVHFVFDFCLVMIIHS